MLLLTKRNNISGKHAEKFVSRSNQCIGKGALFGNFSKQYYNKHKEKKLVNAVWTEHIGYIQINYWLNTVINVSFGRSVECNDDRYKIEKTFLDHEEISIIKAKYIRTGSRPKPEPEGI